MKENLETVNKRLEMLLDYLDITAYNLAAQLKIKPTIIYNVLKGRNKPSFDLLNNICNTLYVNANWLLSGDGEMLKINIPEKVNTNTNIIQQKEHSNVHLKSNEDVHLKSEKEMRSNVFSTSKEAYEHVLEQENKSLSAAMEWFKKTIPVKPHFYFKIHEILKKEDLKLHDIKNSIDILSTFKDAFTQLDEVVLSEVIKYFFRFEGEPFDIKQYENAIKTALNNVLIYEKPMSKLSKAIYEFYNEMNKIGVEGINFDDYKLKEDKG